MTDTMGQLRVIRTKGEDFSGETCTIGTDEGEVGIIKAGARGNAYQRAEALCRAFNERDAMQATIARLLHALFLAMPDKILMQEFRALPVVAQAEKYARDWAKEMAE